MPEGVVVYNTSFVFHHFPATQTPPQSEKFLTLHCLSARPSSPSALPLPSSQNLAQNHLHERLLTALDRMSAASAPMGALLDMPSDVEPLGVPLLTWPVCLAGVAVPPLSEEERPSLSSDLWHLLQ